MPKRTEPCREPILEIWPLVDSNKHRFERIDEVVLKLPLVSSEASGRRRERMNVVLARRRDGIVDAYGCGSTR